MKKTIITLLAMAGVAMGADYTTETIWTAEFGSQYTSGYTTDGLTSAGTFHDASKLATVNGAQTKADGRIHMEGGNYGDWSKDFEFSMTLTLTGDSITAGHISELKASSTGDWLCLGVDGSGALTFNSKDNTLSSVTTTGSVTVGEEYTFTFTKIGNELTFAAGDASVTATLGSAFTGTINNIALGGNTGSNNRVPVLVKSIAMSSVTLAPEPSTPSIPEPATATLSLLALAGLAARRRRR